MNDCIFCKIVKGEIPSKKAYEDDTVLAFYDINPAAPIHVLIIPKKHIQSAQTVAMEDAALLYHLFEVAQKLAKELGVAEDGYRLVTNIGEAAGQSVPHLHLHLLGGRSLQWPPG